MNPQLQFEIRNQILTRTDKFRSVEKSLNYLLASFSFLTSEWDDKLLKTAIFTDKDGISYKVILTNDVCLVPWEVLQKTGYIEVSVFAGDRITTNKVRVFIEVSGYTENAINEHDPTPEVYDQIMSELDEIKTSCEDIEQNVDDSKRYADDAKDYRDDAQSALSTVIQEKETALTIISGAKDSALGSISSATTNSTGVISNRTSTALNEIQTRIDELAEPFIKVQDTQPTDTNNEIWIKETPSAEVQIPTYSEFVEVADAVNDITQPSDSIILGGKRVVFNLNGSVTWETIT